jgi:sporulation protein YqfC
MKNRDGWMQRLTDQADLPGEVQPRQPILEVTGDRRVLMEHHRGVTCYGTKEICVKMPYGHVAVMGSDLQLIRMSAEQLVINGNIDEIKLIRRGR